MIKIKNPHYIKQIDGRTIDEIAHENQQLREKLKYNIECLNLKKKELQENKMTEAHKQLLEKSRKTFAFRLAIYYMLKPDEQQKVYNQLNELIKKQKAKTMKIFMLNNFIYFKTNINIKLPFDKIPLEDGKQLEQINPKDILKLQ